MRSSRFIAFAAALAVAGATPAAAQFADEITATHLGGSLYLLDGALDLIVASVGDDGVLLVDVGYPETEPMVRRALAALGDDQPAIVINTHYHHAFANDRFADATIVAHEKVRDRMRQPNRMAGRDVPRFPAAGLPDVTFSDSLTLHFNDETIRLIHLPAAHTDGDIAVFFDRANVVMTGDAVVPHLPWTDYDAGGRFAGLRRAVDRLVEWIPEDATIVPGHDHPMPYDSLIAFRSMLEAGTQFVEEQQAAGLSVAEIIDRGLPPDLAAWEGGVPQAMFLESIANEPGDEACLFRDGRWYDGESFAQRDVLVVNGFFAEPGSVDTECVVDLAGGWVIPPFGDAHRHDLNRAEGLAEQIRAYLEQGVFYAMEQDPIFEIGPDVRESLNRPDAVDLAYTQGVVSPSWGFITGLYTALAGQGMFGDRTSIDALDGREISLIDSAEDLAAKWDALAARNNDFIKVIVAFSDQFEERSAPAYVANPPGTASTAGLDPSLLPELFRRAHADGLRVSAHIETAADFRVAVAAGADMIAHLPAAWQIGAAAGYDGESIEPWLLTEEDARQAAAAGVQVVTTINRVDSMDEREAFVRVHAHNLRLLAEAGVPVVIGSDGFEPVILAPGEAHFLRTLDVFDDRQLLEMLTVTTPRAIFPGRRIGSLETGYEASFLVLEESPLESFDAIDRITLRVKQGHVLDP